MRFGHFQPENHIKSVPFQYGHNALVCPPNEGCLKNNVFTGQDLGIKGDPSFSRHYYIRIITRVYLFFKGFSMIFFFMRKKKKIKNSALIFTNYTHFWITNDRQMTLFECQNNDIVNVSSLKSRKIKKTVRKKMPNFYDIITWEMRLRLHVYFCHRNKTFKMFLN